MHVSIACPNQVVVSLGYMTISDRLRKAMAEAGMNQKELAAAVGVKPPSVNGWLSSKAKFLRGENLLSAAAALGVRADWLATGEDPMKGQAPSQPQSQLGRMDQDMIAEAVKLLRHELYLEEKIELTVEHLIKHGAALAGAYNWLAEKRARGASIDADSNVLDFIKYLRGKAVGKQLGDDAVGDQGNRRHRAG